MLAVMIVDDMDFDRLEIKRLKLWGEKSGFYIADEAKNGCEALSKLETNPVDLVVTDIKMPKIDGIELLRKIMEKNLCPCVVLLSDYSDFNFARQGLVLGAFDYLKKPANEVEFEDLLKRAKDFIMGKRKELERVKKLEEKLEIYFPKADVNQIIELIENGDFRAINVSQHIIHVISVNLNNDIINVESMLKNIILEIIKEVLKKCKYLDKFLSINKIENVDFSNCDTIESITMVFDQVVKEITSAVNLLYCSSESGIVDQVCNYVLENVDNEISLGDVAENLFMNKTYISELFKQKTGMGFVEYHKIVKMERAKKLIKEGNLKIYEIGEKLGYKDIGYFSRQFKKYSGFTPVEYRQNSIRKQ